MDLERDMILQAQQDAEGFDPAVSTQNVSASEARRQMLEEEISEMQQEWHEKLTEVRQQAASELNEVEIREFQTRINILQRELDDKNREIEQVTREKQIISETSER